MRVKTQQKGGRTLAGVCGAILMFSHQAFAFSLPDRFSFVTIAEAPVRPDPFEGAPLLKRICGCESNLSHYEEDGITVLRGKINRYDVGICQINEYYHQDRIENLGLDIYTLEGNIAFARDLFRREGTDPWVWSKKCWAKER